jgi:hypothetical protein
MWLSPSAITPIPRCSDTMDLLPTRRQDRSACHGSRRPAPAFPGYMGGRRKSWRRPSGRRRSRRPSARHPWPRRSAAWPRPEGVSWPVARVRARPMIASATGAESRLRANSQGCAGKGGDGRGCGAVPRVQEGLSGQRQGRPGSPPARFGTVRPGPAATTLANRGHRPRRDRLAAPLRLPTSTIPTWSPESIASCAASAAHSSISWVR